MKSNRSTNLNTEIPKLAGMATRQAYQQALSSGNTVLVAEHGELVEVFPDQTKRIIKSIGSVAKMEKGQILEIK